MTNHSKSLIDCLKKIRPIEANVYADAEQESEQTNIPLEQLLVKQGVVSDVDLVLATADYLDIRPISLNEFVPNPTLIELIEKDRWANV